MKVLILNGSPRVGGNTTVAVKEMERIFREEGVEVETVQVGARDIRGCIACGRCAETGRCVFDDIVNELAPKLEAADGLVVASPVYYASANATLVACLTRLFYSSHFDKSMKVGASVVCARRGGCSTTFDELNKFFTIAGMPVASSQYWNSIHGRAPGEAEQDEEGRQTMRAHAGPQYDLLDAQHRAGPGEIRPAPAGSAHPHQFHQISAAKKAARLGRSFGLRGLLTPARRRGSPARRQALRSLRR